MRRTEQRIHRRAGVYTIPDAWAADCAALASACAARAGSRANTKWVRLGRRRQEADGSAGHPRARRNIRATGSQCARVHVGRHSGGKPYDAMRVKGGVVRDVSGVLGIRFTLALTPCVSMGRAAAGSRAVELTRNTH
jgi:hypothetical protein